MFSSSKLKIGVLDSELLGTTIEFVEEDEIVGLELETNMRVYKVRLVGVTLTKEEGSIQEVHSIVEEENEVKERDGGFIL